MKKIVLLLVLAALAFWYFDYSHRMTEESITRAYQEQEQALNAMNAEYLCKHMADDYQETSIVHARGDTGQLTMDKTRACARLTQTASMMKRIGVAPGGMISPHYNLEIKRIELSPDRKSASVDIVATLKMGDILLMRSRGTDQVIRRPKGTLILASDSETWAYGM